MSLRRFLTDAERTFCVFYSATGAKTESYRRAYGVEDESDAGSRRIIQLVERLLRRADIEDELAFLALPGGEKARRILLDQLVHGKTGDAMKSASEVLKNDERENARGSQEKFLELLTEIDAEIVMPVDRDATSVRITLSDLMGGGAYVHLPFEAKVKLLHKAGAPWNDHDPKARLSPVQQEALRRRERELLLHGGSGLGKSVLGASFGLVELAIPGSKTAIVGATYDDCAAEFAYVYQGFLELFGRNGASKLIYKNSLQHHDMQIETWWGSRIVCLSMDREDGAAALGKEFDLLILAEAAGISTFVLRNRLLRAIDRRSKSLSGGHQRETGRIVLFTTPRGQTGCSTDEWERVVETTGGKPERLHFGNAPWHETVWIREANVLENPSYSREVFEARRKTLDADSFAEQYLGKITRRSGAVMKEFDRERHMKPRPSAGMIRRMRLGWGIDTGKNFAAILAGVTPENKKYVLAEVYTKEYSTSMNCDDIRAATVEALREAYPEHAQGRETVEAIFETLKDAIDVWYADSASQHKEDLAEQLDVPILFAKIELLSSLSSLRDMFRDDSIQLSDELVWLPWELVRLAWKPQTERNTFSASRYMPQSGNDHAVDALRFVLSGLDQFGVPDERSALPSFEEAFERQTRYEAFGHLLDPGPATANIPGLYRRLHG